MRLAHDGFRIEERRIGEGVEPWRLDAYIAGDHAEASRRGHESA
jgi:hypothetical protein